MNKQKVLVTGAKGQLGVDMVNALNNLEQYQVFGFSRDELDITDENQVQRIFSEINPDIVIHTAAYTKVDLAETEQTEAYRVNAFGTRNIAIASAKVSAKLVYVSTDYVFKGEGTEPYNEYDLVSPINVYGQSKLAGEQIIRDFHNEFFIVRTSWVYGEHGNNFVKTMLRLGREGKDISVVNDQIGCPTYTVDLANTIIDLIATNKFGIYHVSNSGACSWFDFAKEIFDVTELSVNLNPISTEEFPRPAKRPAYSVFNHLALRANGFSEMRSWKIALKEYLLKQTSF